MTPALSLSLPAAMKLRKGVSFFLCFGLGFVGVEGGSKITLPGFALILTCFSAKCSNDLPFFADGHLIPFIDNISMPTDSSESTNKLSGSILTTLTTVCSDLLCKTSSRSIPDRVLEVGLCYKLTHSWI